MKYNSYIKTITLKDGTLIEANPSHIKIHDPLKKNKSVRVEYINCRWYFIRGQLPKLAVDSPRLLKCLYVILATVIADE
jgi:hypothetical protein